MNFHGSDSSEEVIESQTIIKESPEARTEAIPLPNSDSFKRRQKNNKNDSR